VSIVDENLRWWNYWRLDSSSHRVAKSITTFRWQ